MIKKLFLILLGALLTGYLLAQEPMMQPQRLQRTPEEEATQQTERLIRELGIQDSMRIDTIYKMHLKYARVRQKGLTRQENMDRMNAIYAELQQLLTPEEFERFMNHPAELPRRPRGANFAAPREPRPEPNEPMPHRSAPPSEHR